MRLLVVEDDTKMAAAVKRGLEAEGFDVAVRRTASTGCDGHRAPLRPHRARRASGGAGLGPAIVRDLVARHGGTVSAVDADAPGAHLLVRLPLRSQARRQVSIRVAERAQRRGPRPDGQLTRGGCRGNLREGVRVTVPCR